MPNEPVVSPNAANALTKLVATDALPALLGQLVFGNIVPRDFEPTTLQDESVVANATLTHAEATFQIPDVFKVLAVPDLLRLYMEPAIAALAEYVESEFAAATRFFRPGLPDDLLSDENRYLVAGVTAYRTARQNPRFSEYNSPGAAGLNLPLDGVCGRLDGMYVFRSQHLPPDEAALFNRSTLSLVIRRVKPPAGYAEYSESRNFSLLTTMNYLPNCRAQQFTLHLLFGVPLAISTNGVRIPAAELARW